MGRIIRSALAVILISIVFTQVANASSGRWFWSGWWGNSQQQQQKSIQKKVVSKCERDMKRWQALLEEYPDNETYQQYYLEAKKQCEQDKRQYDEKWK